MDVVGVPREVFPGERRVALTPSVVPALAKSGLGVTVQSGAGLESGFADEEYQDRGASVAASEREVFDANVIAQVRTFGAASGHGREQLDLLGPDRVVIGFADPLGSPRACAEMAATGATVLAMELIPRITRAQSMDALSSQATAAGYRAVLLAAEALPKMFPLMITAAGTIPPARVFVIGAGVAGLQAIGTARRLGAVVEAYDVRPAVKEEIESLGARFVELPLETGEAGEGGAYAREMDESFYRRQRELMARVVASSDAVIATAQVQGARAPVLVTADMIAGMRSGSVLVDLAAEQGGNCELTRPGETVIERGVTILGPINLPAGVARDASQMYARNIAALVSHLAVDGAVRVARDDEIVDATLVASGGEIVHSKVREALDRASAEERK